MHACVRVARGALRHRGASFLGAGPAGGLLLSCAGGYVGVPLCLPGTLLSLLALDLRQFPVAQAAGSSVARKQVTGYGRLSLCLLLWEGPREQQSQDGGVGAQPPVSQGSLCTQSRCLTAGRRPGLPVAGSAISRLAESVSSFICMSVHISRLTGTPCSSSALASLPG